jgi:hypothetical protein
LSRNAARTVRSADASEEDFLPQSRKEFFGNGGMSRRIMGENPTFSHSLINGHLCDPLRLCGKSSDC